MVAPPDSVLSMLTRLHHDALLLLSDAADIPLQGLQQGGRKLRLPNQWQRKLREIDLCAAWARHITSQKVSAVLGDLKLVIAASKAAAPANTHRGKVPAVAQHEHVSQTAAVLAVAPHDGAVVANTQEDVVTQDGTEADVTQDGAKADVTQDGAKADVTQDGAEADVTQDGTEADVMHDDRAEADVTKDGTDAAVIHGGAEVVVTRDGTRSTHHSTVDSDEATEFQLRTDISLKFFALAPASQDCFKQSNTYLHLVTQDGAESDVTQDDRAETDVTTNGTEAAFNHGGADADITQDGTRSSHHSTVDSDEFGEDEVSEESESFTHSEQSDGIEESLGHVVGPVAQNTNIQSSIELDLGASLRASGWRFDEKGNVIPPPILGFPISNNFI